MVSPNATQNKILLVLLSNRGGDVRTVSSKAQKKRHNGSVLPATYTEPEALMAQRGWTMDDLGGVTAAKAIKCLLGDRRPAPVHLATAVMRDICAFSLRREFASVLQELLDAGEWEAAVSWARGDGPQMEEWQIKVLRHMAITQGGPLPCPTLLRRRTEIAESLGADDLQTELQRVGYTGGGLAALTAVMFNPGKKANTPKPVHAWTLFGWDGTGGKEGEANPYWCYGGGGGGGGRGNRGRSNDRRGRGQGQGRGSRRAGRGGRGRGDRGRSNDRSQRSRECGGGGPRRRGGSGRSRTQGDMTEARPMTPKGDAGASARGTGEAASGGGAPWLRLAWLGCTERMVATVADIAAAANDLAPLLADAQSRAITGRKSWIERNYGSVQAAPMIGLDTESIPVTGKGQVQPVALLQLASARQAFLFDLPALSADPAAGSAADKLLCDLFCEPGLLKLGQAFDDDLKLLRKAHPKFQAWSQMHNLLDVSSAFHLVPMVGSQPEAEPQGATKIAKVTRAAKQTASRQKKQQPVSLSKLVAYATARPMDKRYQISGWGDRPLLPGQREYAALDARVLLTVASVLGARIGGVVSEGEAGVVEVVQVSSAYLPPGKDLQYRCESESW